MDGKSVILVRAGVKVEGPGYTYRERPQKPKVAEGAVGGTLWPFNCHQNATKLLISTRLGTPNGTKLNPKTLCLAAVAGAGPWRALLQTHNPYVAPLPLSPLGEPPPKYLYVPSYGL